MLANTPPISVLTHPHCCSRSCVRPKKRWYLKIGPLVTITPQCKCMCMLMWFMLSVSQACKFLVSLSKDFSSYYNRVHVLGVRHCACVWICSWMEHIIIYFFTDTHLTTDIISLRHFMAERESLRYNLRSDKFIRMLKNVYIR